MKNNSLQLTLKLRLKMSMPISFKVIRRLIMLALIALSLVPSP